MDLFSFFIGAGSVSVGYLVCSLIVDVIKEYQYKKHKAEQDIKTQFAIDDARDQGMKLEINSLRRAYTELSIQVAHIETTLKLNEKKKR